MKCPIDGATMQLSERAGIEIDYCPECRGIWLDRGELDKLIERGSAPTASTAAPAPPPPPGAVGVGAGQPGTATAGPSSLSTAAMDALRAVRELADTHKRKQGGFPRF